MTGELKQYSGLNTLITPARYPTKQVASQGPLPLCCILRVPLLTTYTSPALSHPRQLAVLCLAAKARKRRGSS